MKVNDVRFNLVSELCMNYNQGHDTTATAAGFTIFHIGNHPEVQVIPNMSHTV